MSIGTQNIMLDCGMHMGYNDQVMIKVITKKLLTYPFLKRRFPDFSYITNNGETLDSFLDCVIISHFHLDHCGALPFMTEMIGYSGPIYMTHPTKAICPILLVRTLFTFTFFKMTFFCRKIFVKSLSSEKAKQTSSHHKTSKIACER